MKSVRFTLAQVNGVNVYSMHIGKVKEAFKMLSCNNVECYSVIKAIRLLLFSLWSKLEVTPLTSVV